MKHLFSLLTLLFLTSAAEAQSLAWARSAGGTGYDIAQDIAVDASGNVYTVGYFGAAGDFDPGTGTFTLTPVAGNDIFILKLDALGNFVWAEQLGGPGNDKGYSIALDASGNVYTTGTFRNTVDFDPGTGVSNLTSAGNQDIFISKLDPAGNFVWAKRMGATDGDYGFSIDIDPSGNVLTTGYFSGTADFDPGAGVSNLVTAGTDFDVFVSKLNAAGTFIWARRLGGGDTDIGQAIATDASGNVYITGYFRGTTDQDPGTGTFNVVATDPLVSNTFITKLNVSGNFIWSKGLGGDDQLISYGIDVDGAGNVYTAGKFTSTCDFDPGAGTYDLTSLGSEDAYLSKLDAAGNFAWAKQLSGVDYEIAFGVSVDNAGNSYTTGMFVNSPDFDPGPGVYTLNAGNFPAVFVSRLDASGNFVSALQMGGGNSDNEGSSIAIDAAGRIYVAGRINGTGDFDPSASTVYTLSGNQNALIVKLSPCQNSAGTDVRTACDSYTWIDGETYTQSTNTPAFILPNAVGCDSIVTLNLTVNHSSAGTDTRVACNSFTWINGVTYNASTSTPTYLLTNSRGCDSLVTLNLTIRHSSTGTDTRTACNSYTWINGITYVQSTNTPVFILQNAAGCDSVVTLHLTVSHSSTGTDIQTACNSYTWINGVTYTASTNLPTYQLTNSAGCDSIVTLHLSIVHSVAGTDVRNACNSFTWMNGVTYTSSTTTPTFQLTSSSGCDSIVTLNLTIGHSTTATDVQFSCGAFTWINGITYIADNHTAVYTIPNASGCDSVVMLDLTVNHASAAIDVHSACESYTWIDGVTYTASTSTPSFLLQNADGCDSVVILDLTIGELHPHVIQSGAVLICSESGGTYQWINCNSNLQIFGATSQSLTTVVNGSYAVIYTEGGCSDTSECVTISAAGMNEQLFVPFLLYPNPNAGSFEIETEKELAITVFNASGQLIAEQQLTAGKNAIRLDDVENGIYLLRATDEAGTTSIQRVSVIR